MDYQSYPEFPLCKTIKGCHNEYACLHQSLAYSLSRSVDNLFDHKGDVLLMRATILLVTADPEWRLKLVECIRYQADLQLVHIVETKEDAIHYCTFNKIDIVLMDVNFTDHKLDELQAVLELSLIGVGTRVIALTSQDNEQVTSDTKGMGVMDYISKDDYRELPHVIRKVMTTAIPQGMIVEHFIRMKEAEHTDR